jgi:hypothetical protein
MPRREAKCQSVYKAGILMLGLAFSDPNAVCMGWENAILVYSSQVNRSTGKSVVQYGIPGLEEGIFLSQWCGAWWG